MLVEKVGYIILISIYLLIVPILADGILNMIGEDNLRSSTYSYASNSNIVKSLAEDVSRVIGMDAFIEKLNDGL